MKLFNKNTKAGFTLVELIVVIAILAILAGIAVPVYSGYIKKANKAADETLLGAVNTAFAAACLENGFNAKDVTDASLTVSGKKITGVSGVTVPPEKIFLTSKNEGYGLILLGAHPAQLGTLNLEKVNESFEKYFGSNVNTELKYFEEFNFADGVFVGVEPGSGSGWTVTDNGNGTITYSNGIFTFNVQASDVNNLKNSVFGLMGAENLTNSVGNVTTVAADLLENDKGKAYMTNEGFINFMEGILPEGTTIDALTSDQKANALVLYAAHLSEGKTGGDYVTAFTTQKTKTMMNLMKNDPQYLADAAAAYATMMAFVNSEYGDRYMVGEQTVREYFTSQTASLEHMSDIAQMFAAVDGATLKNGEIPVAEGKSGLLGYTENYAGAQLNGYLSTLSMVDTNLENIQTDNILTLLQSGYTSNDVVTLLQQVLGN